MLLASFLQSQQTFQSSQALLKRKEGLQMGVPYTLIRISVTKLGDLLDLRKVFRAFVNN